MKIRSLSLVLTFSMIAGCVSAHKENLSVQKGENRDQQVKVSVEKNQMMSTSNFVVLEFTLENKGDEYKRFQSIDLVIPEELKKDIRIVVGQDLVNWSEGIRNKTELEAYNRAMVISGITAVAGASAALSNDPQYQQLAAGVALAGSGTLVVDEFIRIRDSIRDAEKYDTRGLIPNNHILSTPVSIPPNLFLKRFAVFHVKTKTVLKFYKLDLKLNGEGETKSLTILAQFADRPSDLAMKGCEASRGTMYFRKMKISCVEECAKVHPLNRRNCEDTYKRKFN